MAIQTKFMLFFDLWHYTLIVITIKLFYHLFVICHLWIKDQIFSRTNLSEANFLSCLRRKRLQTDLLSSYDDDDDDDDDDEFILTLNYKYFKFSMEFSFFLLKYNCIIIIWKICCLFYFEDFDTLCVPKK